MLAYLLANTPQDSYLLATGRANSAAPYILATGRPVLALGGFLGNEQVLSLNQFTALVKSGKLRFVLGGDLTRQADISDWVQANCSPVSGYNISSGDPGAPGGQASNASLFDCLPGVVQ